MDGRLAGARSESDVVDDLVRQYLREIGAYPLLTAADEVSLAMAIEAGREAEAVLAPRPATSLSRARRRQLQRAVAAGEEARRQFILANLRLVVSIAKRYRSPDMPLLDLVQEGNLGLIRAVEKFDHTRGLQVLDLRHVVDPPGREPRHRRQGPHHPPARPRRRAGRPGAAHRHPPHRGARAGSRRSRRSPPHLGLTVEHGRSRCSTCCPTPCRCTPRSASRARELSELIEDHGATVPFDAAAAALQGDDLRAAMGSLSDRERQVLELRFGLGRHARPARSRRSAASSSSPASASARSRPRRWPGCATRPRRATGASSSPSR